jgi:hypothetical protein
MATQDVIDNARKLGYFELMDAMLGMEGITIKVGYTGKFAKRTYKSGRVVLRVALIHEHKTEWMTKGFRQNEPHLQAQIDAVTGELKKRRQPREIAKEMGEDIRKSLLQSLRQEGIKRKTGLLEDSIRVRITGVARRTVKRN